MSGLVLASWRDVAAFSNPRVWSRCRRRLPLQILHLRHRRPQLIQRKSRQSHLLPSKGRRRPLQRSHSRATASRFWSLRSVPKSGQQKLSSSSRTPARGFVSDRWEDGSRSWRDRSRRGQRPRWCSGCSNAKASPTLKSLAALDSVLFRDGCAEGSLRGSAREFSLRGPQSLRTRELAKFVVRRHRLPIRTH